VSLSETTKPKTGGSFALMVAAGIMASRLLGLLRERVFAAYFGTGMAADAVKAAFKIPNLLQNLFGDGVLSASFIPVYAKLLAENKQEEADRVAGAVFSLLALVCSVLVALGVWGTPLFISLIAPGFEGEKRELTILLVRIFFPGAGILALAAWCLGVLNSHRRFFLSYASPVVWNITIIAALWFLGRNNSPREQLAVVFAWAAVIGGVLQLLFQLPVVFRVAPKLRFRPDLSSEHTRTVLRNFGPVFTGRGVFQLSAYVDQVIASFLPLGGVAILGYAQTLYMLPVSLFGMSISAAELPQMSGVLGSESEVASRLRERLGAGLRQISFFVIPSAVAFGVLGDMVGTVYETGQFQREQTLYLWSVLAGYAVGLLATTRGRLFSSTYYALRDTKTPLKFAIIRVVLATVLGYMGAIWMPVWLGLDARYGAVGLTLGASLAGWVEMLLLRTFLSRRIGSPSLGWSVSLRLWTCALLGGAVGLGTKALLFEHLQRLWLGIPVLAAFGVTYLVLTALWKIPESATLWKRVGKITRRLSGTA
jgi:putative peptidoglycan lipid II flippase